MIKSFCEKFINSHFVGVYPIDKIHLSTRCQYLARCLRQSFNFIVMNSDPSTEDGTHWLLLMKLTGNNAFIFDSFGLQSLENFFRFGESKSYSGPYLDERNHIPHYTFAPISKNYHVRQNNLSNLLKKLSCDRTQSINLYTLNPRLQPENTITCGNFCLYFVYNLIERSPKKTSHKASKRDQLNFIDRVLKSCFSLTDPEQNNRLVLEFSSRFGDYLKIPESSVEYFNFRSTQNAIANR